MVRDVTDKKFEFRLNGERVTVTAEPRRLLADVLRQELGCFGVHLGCEHGVCGACNVIVDGEAVRSCLMLAVQAHGREVVTTEGLGTPDRLHPVQAAFGECHGLQCGFCTPGLVCTIAAAIDDIPDLSDDGLRDLLSGNVCRCTGYANILRAARRAVELTADAANGAGRDDG
jgi:carbon-monoxide dehydrogenase small subunit